MPLVPSWIEYDDEQRKIYTSPEAVECQFSAHLGSLIQPEYLDEIHNMMDDVITTVNYNLFHSAENESVLTNVVNVAYTVQQDSVYLENVIVRPCAEGLGIFKIILYFFIHVCSKRGVRLAVNPESAKVRAILCGITNSFQIRTITVEGKRLQAWVLQPVFLRVITPKHCGIAGKFYFNEREFCYQINHDFFPSHTDLNDPAKLEARKPLKAVVKDIERKKQSQSIFRRLLARFINCFH